MTEINEQHPEFIQAQLYSKRSGLTTFVFINEPTDFTWVCSADRDCKEERVVAVFQDGERIA